MTDLVIPNTITKIHACAFQACTSIKSVTVPESVTEIEQYAFWHAFGLERIVIPSGVTTMGGGIFDSCSALQHYYCFKGTRGDTYWGTAASKYYVGDMDGDKDFTPLDFSALVNASLDVPENLTADEKPLADYNLDGTVDALDCRLVKLLSQGKDLPA